MRNTIDLFICNILGKINNEKENFLFLFPRRPKGRPNICLTCFSVPEGLGVKIATKERSDDCNFHAKRNYQVEAVVLRFILIFKRLLFYRLFY